MPKSGFPEIGRTKEIGEKNQKRLEKQKRLEDSVNLKNMDTGKGVRDLEGLGPITGN